MPAETIHAENPGANTHLRVRWTPSMDVQLGVESVQGYGLLDLLYRQDLEQLRRTAKAVEAVVLDYQSKVAVPGQDGYEELGGLILDAISGNAESTHGLWIEALSRHGCQQLIKTLRRARNAVWGADE